MFEEAGDQPISELQLKARTLTLLDELESKGAHIHIPRMDRDYAISTGLRMLTLRHLVVERDGLYAMTEGEEDVIKYYANSIRHLRR